MKTVEKNRYRFVKSKKKFKNEWNGLPATTRGTLAETSLYKSVFASVFWHIAGALLFWGLSFAIMFFGIAPKLFPPPKPKMNDIEFIIKNPSRHKTHRPKAQAAKSTIDMDKAANPETNAKNNQTPTTESKNQNITPQKNILQDINKSFAKAPAKSSQKSKSAIPDFAMPMPKLKSMSSGLGGSGKTKHNAVGVESSTSQNGGLGNPSSGGSAASGHSGFDKNTTRKIIATYDISPYVNELKRNIRWNWKASKDHGDKRVELFLRIAKDGKIVILNVKRTSEVGEVDNAALSAVRKSAPLNPLPAKYNKSYLDVIFTFDSNSIGSRY